ncbi:hypothetical protein ACO14J_004554 [Vibrio parahaemolyticus]|uniref:hypothetical protein n=1 Tax=Vibrio parahaemolyticus TaxID=670 RepID=UPI00111E68F9|nr:hypothetical protein [Vibrio parahaemolyticus]EJG1664617.1 hypothetical protein [Vibrio parahaemolyticus]EJG1683629.1 hypothetical protein [Vibrio parahaemolyticus]EJG1772569.1 hypothetical protein [Vibrio parahaemolyticus]EJG1796607.1 hypothetical protein [Vibrio parahaemolyticus]MBE4291516.1 hypothetical protein [Vibrio parahaemolyticus]
MLFYHFTDSSSAELICEGGINVGVVPFGDRPPRRYVSLTSNLNPNGHGLYTGEAVPESHFAFQALANQYPELVMESEHGSVLQLIDKTEVAFEIEIHESDPNLMTLDQFILDTIKVLGLPDADEIRNTLKADCIVSGKFPLGESNSLTEQYKKMVEAEKNCPSDHLLGWYFYRDNVPAKFIKRILYKQSDTGYREK